MNRYLPIVALVAACALQGQERRLVRASGEGVVSVQPDLAKIAVGVVTQAATAQDAAAQNAERVEAVLAQLRSVLGANADIKTINYSISPRYTGNPPVLAGYTASNTVEVTISDLTLVGRVIDAAAQAGANNVQSLRFTLRDAEPARAQALALAAKRARGRADAIASGLGVRTGAVITAQEGVTVRPLGDSLALPPEAGRTPIETGLVEVRAIVTVDVELI